MGRLGGWWDGWENQIVNVFTGLGRWDGERGGEAKGRDLRIEDLDDDLGKGRAGGKGKEKENGRFYAWTKAKKKGVQ